MVTEALGAARDLVAAGKRGVLATAISGGGVGSVALLDASGGVLAGDAPPSEIVEAARAVLAAGTPLVVAEAEASWFVEPVLPAPRLIVLGAISVADALVPMAAAAGFAVHVVDTRPWLALPERYPEAESVRCGVPVEVLSDLGMDEATVVVSFLHEDRLEDPVLEVALRGPACYVGSMGSRRTTAAKRERLVAAGVKASLLESLHAPIGLDLGARTPQEIAVAVLAEVVAAARGHA